ncbi:MAG: hypothetical protein C0469_02745 [Cyanobacteria bacterium DS2.3.42]|nr:hypothetical protein [Cyanobacteria bacterium DS2.3.42]
MSKDQGEVFNQIRRRQTEDLSRKVLSSLNKSFVGDQTMAWLQNVNENVDSNATATATLEDPLCQLSMVALMDTLFDDFNRYAYQYNQTEENRSFVVTCRRPAGDGTLDPSKMYQGYLQNSVWGMHARGDTKSVRFSFIPPKFLYEDETNRPAIPAFIELAIQMFKEGPGWAVDGKPLRSSQVPSLSKKIFARLVRVSRGDVSETEPLVFDAVAEKAAEQVMPGELAAPVQSPAETITYSLLAVMDAIDAEVVSMQQEGITAMRSGGMEAVMPIMKRTEALRALRESTAGVAREWAKLLQGG